MASSIGNSRIWNSLYLALNWKQNQGWNSALSIGTKDSFSARLTRKDDDDDDDDEQKVNFGSLSFYA